jgi:hypothetical protein
MPSNTRLRGVQNYGDLLVTEQLQANLSAYLNWGLLCIGGFSNVTVPASGVYGGKPSRLAPAHDPQFTDGQVWQGFRQDWVWESNLDYAYQPIPISGVYVNGNFRANGVSGTYAFHIDYPQGRVVFQSPIPTNSVVTCEYSYRNVRVATADAPWWQELQYNSYRVDDSQFMQIGSGAWNILAQNRIQLPCVVIEPVMNVRQIPLEVGSLSQVHRQDFLFHVIAETPWDRNQLHDILIAQSEQLITSFNRNVVSASGVFPLNWDGSLKPSGVLQYPQLVDPASPYYYRRVKFAQMRSDSIDSPLPLYRAQVRATLETDMP